MAIAHRQDDVAVSIFSLSVEAPFNTAEVAAEVATLLKAFTVRVPFMGTVTLRAGSRLSFSGTTLHFWAGAVGETPGLSPKLMDRRSLYLEVLPLLAGNRVKLLDNQGMVGQFCGLGTARDVERTRSS